MTNNRERIDEERIVPMLCDGCRATMNPHAEKPVEPTNETEAAHRPWVLGGLVEEVHQCARCGAVQSRRV